MIFDTAPVVMTRARAKALGLTKYFTGKPCKNGHIAERYVRQWVCVSCKEQWVVAWRQRTGYAGAEACRSWKRRNPDKNAATIAYAEAMQRGALAYCETYSLESCIPFYEKARQLSRDTGIPHEVDHIIPLARGGQHTASNLQVLTRSANRAKGDYCVT